MNVAIEGSSDESNLVFLRVASVHGLVSSRDRSGTVCERGERVGSGCVGIGDGGAKMLEK